MDTNRFKKRVEYSLPKRPTASGDTFGEPAKLRIDKTVTDPPAIKPPGSVAAVPALAVKPLPLTRKLVPSSNWPARPVQRPVDRPQVRPVTPVEAPPPSPASLAQNVQLNLTIALPSLASLRKNKLGSWLSRSNYRARLKRLWVMPVRVGTLATVVLAITGLSVSSVVNHRHDDSVTSFGKGSIPAKVTSNSTITALAIAPAASTNPVTSTSIPTPTTETASSTQNFTPLVPVGEPQLAKLGSSAYNAKEDSYTFIDLYLAEPLQVSEQPLPTGYGTKANVISKVANSLNAHTALPGAVPAYLGLINNKQTVVSSVGGLLVFLQSAYQHTAAQWQAYLASLQ
jgi:hypothetical protein